MDPDALLRNALCLDFETMPDGRLLKVGAVVGDRVETPPPSRVGPTLAALAGHAVCVLGHNLLDHDLAVLGQSDPDHPLLRLPVIDTLVLSPLCFPENPYHHLVKDYKLVRESRNDPVADARLAARLFREELAALEALRASAPCLLDALHFLLAGEGASGTPSAAGMALVFRVLDIRPLARPDALRAIADLLHAAGCRRFPVSDELVADAASRLALAYLLSWCRVAGANSVIPSWVRHRHPAVRDLASRLRDTPCDDPGCTWCRSTHDAPSQLTKFFGYPDFRPAPASPTGGSLQREIVEAGMRGDSLLAILPTGGGKSLCYQLPALVRHQRLGTMTVVVSPLQALMKDQVDGLVRRTGSTATAALYGLLTLPERAEVHRRIRLGDIALLYVSPEQLRNRSFRTAIAQREISTWVFDEAHCLAKWGHDFRPDYLYAARFVREFSASQNLPVPAIACFTATAKREVRDEILEHFRVETGRSLRVFEGGIERDNLDFEILPVPTHAKLERLHELLSERLPEGTPGSAIVFHAKRAHAEVAAEFLAHRGWKAAHFHAGLQPPDKKRVQDAFLGGETRVICATNAFGMGIDKEDVRLVIHADTPGSLENYLQEAGRAGRDGGRSRCILLFNESDCEDQFRMGALSEVSRRDVAGILRTLRKFASRRPGSEVVVTTGEILRDEDLDPGFDAEDRQAETKVRTALAWLERSGFLLRDENVTRVFQARPLVRTLDEAATRIDALHLPDSQRRLWLALISVILNTPENESLTVDEIALLPEFAAWNRSHPAAADQPDRVGGEILRVLGSMADARLLKRDTLLNAFVRHKVADHSLLRLERVLRVELNLLDRLILEAPDPDPNEWLALSLRLLHQRLVDDGIETSPEMLRDLLRSLAEDGRGMAGSHGSLELHHSARDTYRVRVRRSWKNIRELASKRHHVAALALRVILRGIPPETPPSATCLVPFAFEDLRLAVDQDLALRSELRDVEAALCRGLLFLHEQHVIQLQQGLAIFRSAMTLRLRPQRQGDRYDAADYRPLADHFRARILQVHVMAEYARRGLRHIRQARDLVLAYFQLERDPFLRRYFPGQREALERATTADSFQRIVTHLGNPAQIRIVTAPVHRNLLVLAGPGSGKTRTVVHRCAYLLRIQRVPPRSILVCCFNRRAALELRHRLTDLVGPDARGVTILTYHGLALRLLGRSLQPSPHPADTPPAEPAEIDFDALIHDAVQLLEGKTIPAGLEPDDVRDRLLAGFQHILVDEYQDIDEPQYRLVAALAGRTLDDADQHLSLLAVGDDDQNIYTFRGANVRFIRQFQKDYQADIHPLVENYRATRHLIDTANAVIAANLDRMKSDLPIRIDRDREYTPAGGPFATRDTLARGRVQVIHTPDLDAQPSAVIDELRRLATLGVALGPNCAVLSSTHRDLAAVRAACEAAGIPIRWTAPRHALPPFHQLREIHRFLACASTHPPAGIPPLPAVVRASALVALAHTLFSGPTPNPWVRLLLLHLEAWRVETDDAELPLVAAREFLHEALAETRADAELGDGVTLATVHAAKGAEFDHVLLVGPWIPRGPGAATEELRRAFYVGITRARHTLAVFDHGSDPRRLSHLADAPAILRRSEPGFRTGQTREIGGYETLGLEDLQIGYAGYFPPQHAIHQRLAALQPGDTLALHPTSSPSGEPRLDLLDATGVAVARLSRKATLDWQARLDSVREVRVVAMVHRRAEQTRDETYRSRLQSASWEIPIPEIATRFIPQPPPPP